MPTYLLCPTQGALNNDAVWRLSRTSGWRAACAVSRLDGWLGPARPGSRLPLRTSVAGLGGGISWRPPTQLVYVGHSAAVHICGPNAGRQMVIAWSKSSWMRVELQLSGSQINIELKSIALEWQSNQICNRYIRRLVCLSQLQHVMLLIDYEKPAA